MKTVLVLLFIFGAAFAAPAEDQKKAPEAPVVKVEDAAAPAAVLKETKASQSPAEDKKKASELEDKMMKKAEELPVPEKSIIMPGNAAVLKEAKASQSRYQTCPSGWFTYQHRCYMFVHSDMTWRDAETHCRAFGAHLAPVTNNGEYAYLQELTKMTGQTDAWLGGFYLQGDWMWTASEGFYYENWSYEILPSISPCMYLQTTNGWGHAPCSTCKHFICSKNLFSC